LGFGLFPPPPPPPHEHSSTIGIIRSRKEERRRTGRRGMRIVGRMTQPIINIAHSPSERVKSGTRSAAIIVDVVVTLTAKFEGIVALRFALAGTEQLAPCGAPVQLRRAVPLIPTAPIDSE